MITKTYVEFRYPGAFLSEYSTQEVESRDQAQLEIPENAYAFVFFDVMTSEVDGITLKSERLNVSPVHFYGGRIMTADEVQAELLNSEILVSNMHRYNWVRVIFCRTRNFQPFEDGDIYVPLRSP